MEELLHEHGSVYLVLGSHPKVLCLGIFPGSAWGTPCGALNGTGIVACKTINAITAVLSL